VGAVVSGAIILAAAGGALWKRKHALQFETVRAERGHIVASVAATGTLSAVTTVQVGTQVSGRVAAVYVDFNAPVKKGQALAALDPQLLQAAVDQAKANYDIARGGLAKAAAESARAGRELRRGRSLYKQDLLTRQELDAEEANYGAAGGGYAAAKGALDQAKAALHQAKVSLDYAKIISPIDGVVVSRTIEPGQTVAASLQAPTLFTIAQDSRKMQIDTNVAEGDVGKLRAGMKATFRIDAFPGEKFQGIVRQIRSAPQVAQGVVTYDAVVDVDNSDLRMRQGMTANVSFVVAEKDDAVKIPAAALRFRPPVPLTNDPQPLLGEDERVVWKLVKGRAQPVRVRTGLAEGRSVEVVEGAVTAGDAVVVDVVGEEPTDGKKGKETKDSKLKVF
jgi:HlyD family secretion protein